MKKHLSRIYLQMPGTTYCWSFIKLNIWEEQKNSCQPLNKLRKSRANTQHIGIAKTRCFQFGCINMECVCVNIHLESLMFKNSKTVKIFSNTKKRGLWACNQSNRLLLLFWPLNHQVHILKIVRTEREFGSYTDFVINLAFQSAVHILSFAFPSLCLAKNEN